VVISSIAGADLVIMQLPEVARQQAQVTAAVALANAQSSDIIAKQDRQADEAVTAARPVQFRPISGSLSQAFREGRYGYDRFGRKHGSGQTKDVRRDTLRLIGTNVDLRA
jgi:hypothetical protein